MFPRSSKLKLLEAAGAQANDCVGCYGSLEAKSPHPFVQSLAPLLLEFEAYYFGAPKPKSSKSGVSTTYAWAYYTGAGLTEKPCGAPSFLKLVFSSGLATGGVPASSLSESYYFFTFRDFDFFFFSLTSSLSSESSLGGASINFFSTYFCLMKFLNAVCSLRSGQGSLLALQFAIILVSAIYKIRIAVLPCCHFDSKTLNHRQ